MRVVWTVGAQLKRVRGNKILAAGLKTIMIFWQRMWLLFCPCPKDLPEANLKWFVLMALAEEISRQHSIDFVGWLLQIYNEKEQGRQREYKLHNLRRKRAPGNVMMEPTPMLREVKSLKNGLMVIE